MDNGLIYRPALGRGVKLGDLYDARVDAFCGTSVFEKELPQDSIRSIDCPFTEYRSQQRLDTFSDKCRALLFTGDIQLSLLANMVIPVGSGEFLTDHMHSGRTERKHFILSTKTKNESINFLDDDVLARISQNYLDAAAAKGTHVVQEIMWGETMVMSVPCKNNGNGDITFPGDQEQVKYFGDVSVPNEELPVSATEVTEFLRSAPIRMSQCNDGKGQPMSFRLVPIHQLQMYKDQSCRIITDSKPNFRPVGECHVAKVVRAFDELTESRRRLNDFHQEALQSKQCMEPQILERITEYCRDARENPFPGKLKEILKEVRSGRDDVRKLDELVIEMREIYTKASAIHSTWRDVIEKIKIIELLEKKEIQYIGINVSLENALAEMPLQNALLIYFSQKWKSEDPERWTSNMRLILDKSEDEDERKQSKFFAVDCEFHSNPKILNTCVQVIKGGKVIVEDLLAVEENLNPRG